MQPTGKVEQRRLDELRPYDRNARRHSEAQIEQIAGLIERFGFRVPILIDGESVIIAGHGRLEAAKHLGLDHVPCIVVDDLSDETVRALRLADNRVAANASWDQDLLRLELADLAELEVDLGTLGFAEAELRALMASPEDFAPVAADEQGRLDACRPVVCPSCGHAFSAP